MSDFELKIKIGDAILELKGDKKEVDEMYDKINSTFMVHATERKIHFENDAIAPAESAIPILTQENTAVSIPQLKLKLQNSISEKDWLLIYLYVFTEQGAKLVNQDEFKKFYLDDRKSKSATANYRNSLKASAEYLNLVDDENMAITQKGVERVIGLADGAISTKQKRTTDSAKTTNKQSKAKVKFNKIDLGIEDEPEFIERFKAYQTKTITDKIYVLCKLYKDEKNIEEFTIDTIHSLLDLVSVDTPPTLAAMMRNFVSRNKTFDRIESGSYKIKYKGLDIAKSLLNCNQG